MQAVLATFSPLARMQDYIPQPNEQFTHVIEGRIRTEFADGREIELARRRQRHVRLGRRRPPPPNLVDAVTRMLIVIRRPRLR